MLAYICHVIQVMGYSVEGIVIVDNFINFVCTHIRKYTYIFDKLYQFVVCLIMMCYLMVCIIDILYYIPDRN